MILQRIRIIVGDARFEPRTQQSSGLPMSHHIEWLHTGSGHDVNEVLQGGTELPLLLLLQPVVQGSKHHHAQL